MFPPSVKRSSSLFVRGSMLHDSSGYPQTPILHSVKLCQLKDKVRIVRPAISIPRPKLCEYLHRPLASIPRPRCNILAWACAGVLHSSTPLTWKQANQLNLMATILGEVLQDQWAAFFFLLKEPHLCQSFRSTIPQGPGSLLVEPTK